MLNDSKTIYDKIPIMIFLYKHIYRDIKQVSGCRDVRWEERLTKKVQEGISWTDQSVLYSNCVVS